MTANAAVGSIDDGSLLLSHIHKFGLISSDEASTPTNLRLILASQSPRRQEILDLMGLSGRYIAQPSPLDEEALQIELAKRKDYTPRCYALELAERKAHAMAVTLLTQNNNSNNNDDGKITLVIGSDTIVDLDGEIMNKPTNEADAYNMLKKLSGKWHKVHTGVAIYVVGAKHVIGHDEILMESHTDTASVKFANLTDSDIHAYIATKEPMDKAGSYGIQGVGGQFVERLEGDYFTIMGLSMHRLGKELAQTIRALGI
jgi:septum formation protein